MVVLQLEERGDKDNDPLMEPVADSVWDTDRVPCRGRLRIHTGAWAGRRISQVGRQLNRRGNRAGGHSMSLGYLGHNRTRPQSPRWLWATVGHVCEVWLG